MKQAIQLAALCLFVGLVMLGAVLTHDERLWTALACAGINDYTPRMLTSAPDPCGIWD